MKCIKMPFLITCRKLQKRRHMVLLNYCVSRLKTALKIVFQKFNGTDHLKGDVEV